MRTAAVNSAGKHHASRTPIAGMLTAGRISRTRRPASLVDNSDTSNFDLKSS